MNLSLDERPIKILHVDDLETNHWYLERKLNSEDSRLNLHWVKSYYEALDLLDKDYFDCVITDFHLGQDKNGIDLIRKLREKLPAIPVFMLTSQGNEEVAAEAFKAGVTDYFARKVGYEYFARLLRTIRSYIEKARIESQKEQFKNLFVEAVKVTPSPFVLINSSRKIIYWNEACEKLTGIKAADALNTDIYRSIFWGDSGKMLNLPDLVFEDKIDDTLEDLGIVKNGIYYIAKGRFVFPGGLAKHLKIAASPVRDMVTGKICAVIQTICDLSDTSLEVF